MGPPDVSGALGACRDAIGSVGPHKRLIGALTPSLAGGAPDAPLGGRGEAVQFSGRWLALREWALVDGTTSRPALRDLPDWPALRGLPDWPALPRLA